MYDGTAVRPGGTGLAEVVLNRLQRRPASTVVFVVELAVVPELGRIADRRDLDIGVREQGLDVRDPLPARANHGHVQLLARRYSVRRGGGGSAQDVRWDDTGDGQSGGLGQQPATTEGLGPAQFAAPYDRTS